MSRFLSFMAGCGAGILAGMVLAPRSGQELRTDISNKVHEGMDKLNVKVEEGRRFVEDQGGIRGVVEKGVERGKNVAKMGMDRVRESVEDGKAKLNDSLEAGKSRLSEAVEAGRTEYEQQRNRDVSGI